MRIGIDFDDVIYPYHRYLKRKIKDRFGVDLDAARVTTFFYDHHPELAARGATRDEVWRMVEATWLDPDDHGEALLLDPAIPEILGKLQRRHDVAVISARSEASREHVVGFLKRHGIQVDEVLLGRFDKVGYDVLIDDFPKHAVENARHGGWSILFTIDENSTFDETKEPRVLRAESWDDVARLVEAIEEMRDHA
jgi:hypothetical protein